MLRIIEITTHEQVDWGATAVVAVLSGIAILLIMFLGMLVIYGEDVTEPQYKRNRRVACAIVVATICVIVSNFQLKTTKEDIKSWIHRSIIYTSQKTTVNYIYRILMVETYALN